MAISAEINHSMMFRGDVKKRTHRQKPNPESTMLILFRIMTLHLALGLCSCVHNDSGLSRSTHTVDETSLFSGEIAGMVLTEQDRLILNNLFERTPSFRQASLQTSRDRKRYLIILRPAFQNRFPIRVCRPAEIFPRSPTGPSFFITGCRNRNGQWQLAQKRKK